MMHCLLNLYLIDCVIFLGVLEDEQIDQVNDALDIVRDSECTNMEMQLCRDILCDILSLCCLLSIEL